MALTRMPLTFMGLRPLATVYVDGAAQTVQGARRGLRSLWDVSQIQIYRSPLKAFTPRQSLGFTLQRSGVVSTGCTRRLSFAGSGVCAP
jgi:hypothetical protein